MPIGDIAERYSISERTAYRDLRALEEAGVPIGIEPGKGYYILRGYHLPPVMFNNSEAASLLAGERLMQRWQNTELGRSYKSALEKIRSVLPKEELQYFESLDEHIQTFPSQYIGEDNLNDKIFSGIQQAIFKTQVLELQYQRPYKDEVSCRKVEPLGLFIMGRHWYLAAWCRLREDYRMFRLDRVLKYHPTGERLPANPEHTLQTYYNEQLKTTKELTEVVLQFNKEIAGYLGDQKYWHGWAWEKSVDNVVEMTFLTGSLEYLSYWILSWGTGVTVISPDEMKDRMRDISKEIAEHHGRLTAKNAE